MAAGDEGHAQAVAGRSGRGLEVDIETAVVVTAQNVDGAFCAGLLEREEVGAQALGQGHGVEFARVVVGTLGIGEVDNATVKVDVGEGNGRFRKATTQVGLNFKNGAHPFGAIDEDGAGAGEGSGIEVGSGHDGRARDAGQGNRVALAVFAPDGLGHDEGEELHLKPRGVSADAQLESPRHVFGSVLVADLARVAQVVFGQKDAKVGPSDLIAAQAGSALVVRGDVGGDPMREVRGLARPVRGGKAGFIVRGLLRLAAGGARLFEIVMAQLGRFFAQLAGVRIAGAQKPVGGAGLFPQEGHTRKVSPSVTRHKKISGFFGGTTWINREAKCAAWTYRYTTRQCKYLRTQRFTKSVTFGVTGDTVFFECGMAWIFGLCRGLSKAKGAWL